MGEGPFEVYTREALAAGATGAEPPIASAATAAGAALAVRTLVQESRRDGGPWREAADLAVVVAGDGLVRTSLEPHLEVDVDLPCALRGGRMVKVCGAGDGDLRTIPPCRREDDERCACHVLALSLSRDPTVAFARLVADEWPDVATFGDAPLADWARRVYRMAESALAMLKRRDQWTAEQRRLGAQSDAEGRAQLARTFGWPEGEA